MTDTIKELFARTSVRVFTKKKISKESRRLILESAAQAPTAGNMQMYTIIDVQDQKIKDALAKSCDNQPFIATAPMVLIFCADYIKWTAAFKSAGAKPRKLGAGDLMLAAADACIAAQNAVTAAWSLGIGSCYIGDILENCEIHRELLALPDGIVPVAMIVFGYPTKQQLEHDKPARVPLDKIVSVDRYPVMDDEYLREMFDEKTRRLGYEAWMNGFCKRKYNSDFAREMTRSVKEYMKFFK